eukprot:UN33669
MFYKVIFKTNKTVDIYSNDDEIKHEKYEYHFTMCDNLKYTCKNEMTQQEQNFGNFYKYDSDGNCLEVLSAWKDWTVSTVNYKYYDGFSLNFNNGNECITDSGTKPRRTTVSFICIENDEVYNNMTYDEKNFYVGRIENVYNNNDKCETEIQIYTQRSCYKGRKIFRDVDPKNIAAALICMCAGGIIIVYKRHR